MKTLREKFRKGGKKFLIGWAAWFIIKWTIILTIGKSIWELIP
ncbi:MAG TPA: hypothetical protein VIK89_08365 [Cytophagaceae bacterium]